MKKFFDVNNKATNTSLFNKERRSIFIVTHITLNVNIFINN